MTAQENLSGNEIGGASGSALSVPQDFVDAYWGSCDCCVCGCVSAQLCQQRKHRCCIQVSHMGTHECTMR